jgi:hypothetical protein
VIGLSGCGDFVDEDGNTSIRQVAEGLQTLGDRVAEMGEALERDADIEAVPWETLEQVIPSDIDGVRRVDLDGDDEKDRNGAGMSIAHGTWVSEGDSMFVGVADLGAFKSGVDLALRWIAPLFDQGHIDGDIEETEVRGYPAIQIRDEDDGDLLVALIVDGRFAVVAGGEGRHNDDFVWEALDEVDYRRLEGWTDYGRD